MMISGVTNLVAASYLAWGGLKGRRRGLAIELPRLVSVTLVFITGTGLSLWAAHALSEIDKLTGQIAGALGWGGALVGAFYLARQLRGWMGSWILDRMPEERVEKQAGMAAGLLRTLVIGLIVTLFLLHTPLAFLVRDSAIGSLARIVQPAYHITNKPRP
jgi:hypothetical protein